MEQKTEMKQRRNYLDKLEKGFEDDNVVSPGPRSLKKENQIKNK